MAETLIETQLTVNGRAASVPGPPDRTLLEVLREDLELTGTKYGCGEGECGACTVHIDGQCRKSCQTAVADAVGREIKTIEGLADGDDLHVVQKAFLQESAFQCGYCTAGMIMATAGLLASSENPTDGEIIEAMNGNVCRCIGYIAQMKAVRRAIEMKGAGQ